jgi:hypothetical protein
MIFPKLKYPIKTKGLTHEAELILLAYDMIYRAMGKVPFESVDADYDHDLSANLSNLGYYIEHRIPNGEEFFELADYCKDSIFASNPNE